MTDKDLLVSLIDLPSEIGSHLEQSLSWTVPEGWDTEVLRLIPGQVLPLDLSLTAIDGGVLLGIKAHGTLEGECVRCLDPVSVPWTIDTYDVYSESGAASQRRTDSDADIEAEGDELDPLKVIDRNSIDIEPVLRDAIFGNAPLQPVCDESCEGLCPHCGIRMEDAEPGHAHEFVDPRFAALEGFFADQEAEGK